MAAPSIALRCSINERNCIICLPGPLPTSVPTTPAWGVTRRCTRSVWTRYIITPTLVTACRLASSHPSASPWGGIEEGDEVSPWVSHVSWHMMMFSFLLIRQRPCMHPCLAPVPYLLLYLTSFESVGPSVKPYLLLYLSVMKEPTFCNFRLL